MAHTMKIQILYKTIEHYHVFTSPDLQGLYVAHPDLKEAFNEVAPCIQVLIMHLFKKPIHSITVTSDMSFSEFKQSLEYIDNPPEENFTVKLAA